MDPWLRDVRVRGWPQGSIRRDWDDCGEAPPVPEHAVAVECDGPWCVAICPEGWQSAGRWKIRCRNAHSRWQRNHPWTHSEFSPCKKRLDYHRFGIDS